MNLNLKVKQLPNFIDFKDRQFGNAGFDLYAAEYGSIAPNERRAIAVGISTSFNPEYYMRVAPRSGLALKDGIDVLAGVIDSSYRGEWKVILYNTSNQTFFFDTGQRIAQAIPERITTENFEFVQSLEESVRNEQGFGSSGN
jgi:dUTP pyrophosphatase